MCTSKLRERLAVWDEDPDSFDDFAAQMSLVQIWLEQLRTPTGDSTCGATVCCKVERRGTLSGEWTTGIFNNGSDLSVCVGESVKKYADS